MHDFSRNTIRALARKGITLVGLQAIPNMASALPFVDAVRGYRVNDNGCGRVWTFAQVLEASK